MVRRCMDLVSVILSENERERENTPSLFLVLVVGERKRKKNERQARHTIEMSIGHWTWKMEELRE